MGKMAIYTDEVAVNNRLEDMITIEANISNIGLPF